MNKIKPLILATCCALVVSSNALALDSKLLPVPTAGTDNLNESDLNYYQQMGPLEYTGHALPVPHYPAWRLHFSLNPQMEDGVLSGYQVTADRINLSPLIYQELIDSYGKDAADPALNNTTPSDRHTLPFIIVQNIAADLLAEDVEGPTSPQTDQACGLQPDCGKTWGDNDGDWGQAKSIELEAAPWKADSAAPALLRALALQSDWLQQSNAGYQWVAPEQPEGMGEKQHWVEVTIDNYPGNGGMLLADWVEVIGDDSAAKKVIRLVHDPATPKQAMVFSAYLCSRGTNTKNVAQKCP